MGRFTNFAWPVFNLILILIILFLIYQFVPQIKLSGLFFGLIILFAVLLGGMLLFYRKGLSGLSVISILIIMTITGLFAPKGINWILELIFLFLFFLVVGSLVSKRLSGILIDERNQMSLSRFQIVVWTLIILSAYLSIALARITAGVADPLAIGIDWQLWALLGISSTSLVGSPLLLSEKKDRESSLEEKARFDKITQEKNENLQLFGKIPVRDSPNDALFTDIFRGDEAATFYNINMAKVQMFFFTIIAALSYGFAILTLVINTDSSMINNLPPVSPGLVAILGISHAAYLTNKGIDQTG